MPTSAWKSQQTEDARVFAVNVMAFLFAEGCTFSWFYNSLGSGGEGVLIPEVPGVALRPAMAACGWHQYPGIPSVH